jgi:hypothetical protein
MRKVFIAVAQKPHGFLDPSYSHLQRNWVFGLKIFIFRTLEAEPKVVLMSSGMSLWEIWDPNTKLALVLSTAHENLLKNVFLKKNFCSSGWTAKKGRKHEKKLNKNFHRLIESAKKKIMVRVQCLDLILDSLKGRTRTPDSQSRPSSPMTMTKSKMKDAVFLTYYAFRIRLFFNQNLRYPDYLNFHGISQESIWKATIFWKIWIQEIVRKNNTCLDLGLLTWKILCVLYTFQPNNETHVSHSQSSSTLVGLSKYNSIKHIHTEFNKLSVRSQRTFDWFRS